MVLIWISGNRLTADNFTRRHHNISRDNGHRVIFLKRIIFPCKCVWERSEIDLHCWFTSYYVTLFSKCTNASASVTLQQIRWVVEYEAFADNRKRKRTVSWLGEWEIETRWVVEFFPEWQKRSGVGEVMRHTVPSFAAVTRKERTQTVTGSPLPQMAASEHVID